MRPLVSVIIPVYNDEQHLSESIDSILNQTLSDIEIICINDGSTDSSPRILEEYAALDQRIIILNQEHSNAGVARNFGLQHARGKYTYFFDADDLCSETLLEETTALAKQKNADIVAFDFVRFSDEGTVLEAVGVHDEWLPKGLKVFNYRDCPNKIMNIIYSAPWNKIYRTHFLISCNLYFDEISSSNDVAFTSVSLAYAQRITFIKKSFIHHRINHAGTITSTKYLLLNNVMYAVQSAAQQIQSLSYYQDIKIAYLYFAIANYMYTFNQYINDFSSNVVHEFYDSFHSYFCTSEFSELTYDQIDNLKLYQSFIFTKNNDYHEMSILLSRRLIVSLTSYPKRIGNISLVLESIFNQTKQPDQIILWLSEEQFPNKESDLPYQLLEYQHSNKLEIRWCAKDIKPHKKYLYAMQEYPDDLIVTIDDDMIFRSDLLECLFRSYLANPTAISTVRAHLIVLSEDGAVLPYIDWPKQFDTFLNVPSIYLFATGGAGAIYPPHLLPPELLDENLVMELCPYADDLWLKTMQLIADVPVVLTSHDTGLNSIPNTQSDALKVRNVYRGNNDKQLQLINTWLSNNFNGYTWSKFLKTSSNAHGLRFPEVFCTYVKDQYTRNNAKLLKLKTDKRKLDAKLQQTYADKSEINAKLQQTYAEKSEINAKLQQTYAEKSERGILIKELNDEIQVLKQQNGFIQQELDATRASFSFRLGHALTRPARWFRDVLKR